MKTRRLVIVVSLALGLIVASASAEPPWERGRGRGFDRFEDFDRWDRGPGRGARHREGVPAFCRSGEGHPVFGRRWCYERGYGYGGGRGWLDALDAIL